MAIYFGTWEVGGLLVLAWEELGRQSLAGSDGKEDLMLKLGGESAS